MHLTDDRIRDLIAKLRRCYMGPDKQPCAKCGEMIAVMEEVLERRAEQIAEMESEDRA